MNDSSSSPLAQRLAAPLRWTPLVAVTTACLAMLALADRSAGTEQVDVPVVAAAVDHAAADPIHDPAARLGALLQPLSLQGAQDLGLIEGTALTVLRVQADSQAARAGLQEYDVITAIAGAVGPGTAAGPTTNATWDALCAALDERATGGTLDFFVRRDGRTRIVHVQVDALGEAARSNVAEAAKLPQTACV